MTVFFAIGAQTADAAQGLVKPINNLGLAGYWSMEDASGTKATDFSGSGYPSTLQNMAAPATATSGWNVNGRRGTALAFDGINDYTSTTLAWPSSGSIMLWTYPTTATDWISPAGWKLLGSNNGYILIDEGSGNPGSWRAVFKGNNSGASEAAISSTNTITYNRWYHIAMTWSLSGSTYTIALFVDGVQQGATTTWTGAMGSSGVGFFHFGNSGDYADNYFKGRIDEVRVYSRALLGAEVADMSGSRQVRQTNPNNNGLVAYWSMEDASGTKATDFSGQGNTGTLTNGPTWTTSKRGKAISFDGTNDYVSVAWPFTTDITSQIQSATVSMCAWFKTTSVSGELGILGVGDSGSNGLNMALISGKLSFWYSSGGAIVQYTTALSTNVWYHACGVVTSFSSVQIYLNGAQVRSASTGLSSFTLAAVGSKFVIGNEGQLDSARYFPGIIDDVRIYNRTLSAAEVSALYGAGSQRVNAADNRGLVDYQSFEDATGTKATDFSGNYNTGVLTNMAAPATATSGWTKGKFGSGISFDGTNDYVNLGSGATMNITGDVSFSVWIKTSTDAKMIFQDYDANSPFQGFAIMIGQNVTANKIGFVDGAASWKTSTTSVTDGKWHHIVVTGSGTSGTFYFDGAADGTFTYTAPTSHAGEVAYLGAYEGTSNYFNGSMDEFRMYNRALSATEVSALYTTGR